QPDVDASEAILGYRLRQHHLGVVAWITGASPGGDALSLLERVTGEVAVQVRCDGKLMFVPQDESTAWAGLPLGGRNDIVLSEVNIGDIAGGDRIRLAFGEPGVGMDGFRRTHQQALSAQAVALAAGPAVLPVTTFAEVAPLALMTGSLELLRA